MMAGPNILRTTVAVMLGALFVGVAATRRFEPSEARSSARRSSNRTTPYVTLPENDEAWGRLPRAVRGAGAALPPWAKALATSLPRTTVAMLRLDHLHRTSDILEPVLRARMRWEVANANGSAFGEACAEADLRRAGLHEWELGKERSPNGDALAFARRLTIDGDAISDADVAHLIGRYGEKRVVAMVLLVAHASFQDRLLLALGLAGRRDGAELGEFVFDERRSGEAPPRRPPLAADTVARDDPLPDSTSPELISLEAEIARQRGRRSRIRLPADDGGGNRWGLVCRVYQPELSAAWSACKSAFEAEADMDPVFSASLFWVVTRTLRCFY